MYMYMHTAAGHWAKQLTNYLNATQSYAAFSSSNVDNSKGKQIRHKLIKKRKIGKHRSE